MIRSLFFLIALASFGKQSYEPALVEPLEFVGQEAAVEEVRAALFEDSYPWYDVANDSFVMPNQPPADRKEWKAAFAMILNVIIMAFIIGTLVVMGWLFYRKRSRDAPDDADSADEAADEVDAVMALPPELAIHADDFLAAAERAAAAGDYRLAICCLFHHLLDQLGEAGLLRLSRGRTNRQYLRQLAEHPSRPILGDAMRLFESIYFGGHPANAAMWEQMRSSHSAISREISRPKYMPGVAIALVAGLLFLGGCGNNLNTEYGRSAGNSINGTQVLFRMLEARGHTVFRWEPGGEKSQADSYVVFAPGNWRGRGQVREWLRDESQVVFVAGDFDALYYFWDDIADEARRRGMTDMIEPAQSMKFDVLGRMVDAPAPAVPLVYFEKAPHPVISGQPDASAFAPTSLRDAGLYLNHFPDSPSAESLLTMDGSPYVIRRRSEGYGDLFVVANGGFLLNYALINHDRRILASRLIDQLGEPRRIAFVEAFSMGRGSGRVRRSNPFHLLSDHAGRYVFLHLLAFALLWLAMKSPILGKPKRQLSGAVHRFSAHLRAYASLLYRSGDRRHAEDLISTYEKPGAPHE